MSDLSETEIFDCLATNFRLAAEHCADLAKLPRKGPTYTKLREELGLIEGAARQAAYWRQDSRWLIVGKEMAEVHRRAGDWLRGIKGPGGQRIKIAPGHMHPLFVKLAEKLLAYFVIAEGLRTRATGRLGLILPDALPAPHRETRPVQVLLPKMTPGGIVIPDGVSIQ